MWAPHAFLADRCSESVLSEGTVVLTLSILLFKFNSSCLQSTVSLSKGPLVCKMTLGWQKCFRRILKKSKSTDKERCLGLKCEAPETHEVPGPSFYRANSPFLGSSLCRRDQVECSHTGSVGPNPMTLSLQERTSDSWESKPHAG